MNLSLKLLKMILKQIIIHINIIISGIDITINVLNGMKLKKNQLKNIYKNINLFINSNVIKILRNCKIIYNNKIHKS